MDSVQDKCQTAERILSEQLQCITRAAGFDAWEIHGIDVKSAGQGLCGFLGDHFRVVVHLKKGNLNQRMHLFAKFLPLVNTPKAKLITESHFFTRETMMYSLFDKLGVYKDANPWCPRALIHNDSILVMPDLSHEGYRTTSKYDYLDIKHVLVTITSIAKFHAMFACYEANMNTDPHKPYSFHEDHREQLFDSSFTDSPWMRSAAKLTFNLLRALSTKRLEPNVEQILTDLFVKACNDLRERKDTLNVLIHRDMWANNIMYRYENEEPKNAVILDYQCLRYGPPAFDIMIFLYLCTSRKFRELHEKEVFNHYYTVFTQCLDDVTKGKLKDFNYGRWDLFNWCEKARRFAMVEAIVIFPYTLMEPSLAEKTFDDPDTYLRYMEEDRSEPVLQHARDCTPYRERQLEVSEEFVERYVIKLHTSK